MSESSKKGRRDDLPRRVGEVLSPALDRIATSDQARAYSAWSRAVGERVAASTRPKAFGRGRLTVVCDSSVWANELMYLSPQILRRMDEVLPGHPVERFRFIVGSAGVTEAEDPPGGGESVARSAKKVYRDGTPTPGAYEAARAEAEGVHDERLRGAIEAALRRSSEEPLAAPGDDDPSG